MNRLDGKVAIVTGAARGIGAATAKLFVAEGAHVVITDVLTDQGKAMADSLGTKACFMQHDVSQGTDWTKVIAETESRFGPISILVNNAGIQQMFTPVHECSEEIYRHVIDVNQFSVFLGMKAVVPSMCKAGRGSIINISSAMGLVGLAGTIAYAAAKFAVTGMTKVAALDLGRFGIRVNSVHPGLVNTPMMAGNDNAQDVLMAGFIQSLPAGRPGEPIEIAELICFLASEGAGYCTGSAFSADGGWTAS